MADGTLQFMAETVFIMADKEAESDCRGRAMYNVIVPCLLIYYKLGSISQGFSCCWIVPTALTNVSSQEPLGKIPYSTITNSVVSFPCSCLLILSTNLRRYQKIIIFPVRSMCFDTTVTLYFIPSVLQHMGVFRGDVLMIAKVILCHKFHPICHHRCMC